MQKPDNYNEVFEATLREALAEQEATTETLNRLLTDCIFFNSPGNIHRVVNHIVLQPRMFAGLAGLDANLVDNICQADIRKNFHYFQYTHNISSIIERHVAIRDRFFSFKDTAHQLRPLDEDKVILKNEVARIAEYFFSLLDGYHLAEEDFNGEILPINMQKLQATIARSHYASITTQSEIWEQVSETEWLSHNYAKQDPDKIRLYLESWYEDTDEEDKEDALFDGDYYLEFCAIALHPSITPSELKQS